MVNVQDEIEMTHQTSKFTMVLPVDQSENIRMNSEWTHVFDLMFNSNHKHRDKIMQESVICNRDSKQAVLSYREYKRCPSEFVLRGLYLVRKGLLQDLRKYNNKKDRSFLLQMNLLRIVGFDNNNIFVEKMAIHSNLDDKDNTKWFIVPSISTCLVVFAIAAEDECGFCPWHPIADATTATKRNEEIDLRCFICFSLDGKARYNGLRGRKCIYITCKHKAHSAGMCVNHRRNIYSF